jgi:hypothetical protein
VLLLPLKINIKVGYSFLVLSFSSYYWIVSVVWLRTTGTLFRGKQKSFTSFLLSHSLFLPGYVYNVSAINEFSVEGRPMAKNSENDLSTKYYWKGFFSFIASKLNIFLFLLSDILSASI